ncbi:GNAT family N-acetyltransferase [Pseudomonas citronellolis]|uniref:GNAT family N-acetyltransferase n=1 Tax=Pseudomonas citronellolis TaxID=53408 RepID=UPI0023E38709|nr:GNAT family N-acetyltransferase [Pseudomonas citronellolis]MDF3937101.1 GNAT family N-acetyltransferase [Pseudomonas citronellolis]
MSSPTPHETLPLPDGRRLGAELGGTRLTLLLDGHALLALERDGQAWRALSEAPSFALWAFAYWQFARDESCQALLLHAAQCPAQAFAEGLAYRNADGLAQIERAAFWQLPQPWLRQPGVVGFPQLLRVDGGKRHPLRPPKPQGEVYRRFDARLGSWVSLRTLDIDADLERFNRWQNSPRVLEFWQEGGTLAQHRAYLEKLAQDPHALTLIGCFDDQPFAYYEAYWAKEDRIAPFYAADDYDRGIHMLVGEEAHRGPHKVESWLNALVHYLLLDEPRTQRVVAEPRADNAKMIGHMQRQGFWREKEFDFPHKRAALMVQSRENFFERCRLC